MDNVILPATALRAARCARAGGQMKIPSALDVLRARAREDSDLAAKALGQVRHACQQAAAKLEQLLAYELEYRQKLQSGLTAGIVSGDYENFQHFILTLETAIAQHRHALNQWKEKLHQAMALWQSKQQRLNALSTLHSRL
ncbi:flagellar export protein FliJ [Candidatus Sodalis sp. SoCistrobi]|uniref:flagellar export protein FliJ n=1 Tax=Candidatus Sodalis sp. SoCistrobi TaxID=1922216 RepID=UPI001576D233|nr:flagellar export protein FliJ [Candidatus Sodalis sp. SoCistrobi]